MFRLVWGVLAALGLSSCHLPSATPRIELDVVGIPIDAHDGKILQHGGEYYWYGTSYACGYFWDNAASRFCGFKVYSSKDAIRWEDRGFIFDAQTPEWQKRCAIAGCFRPHPIYNPRTRRFVVWVNIQTEPQGFRVFESESPVGPFREAPLPEISSKGPRHGDFDLFRDQDGSGYIAYTDWSFGNWGTVWIEKLSDTFLSGAGPAVHVTGNGVEAPSLFRRGEFYYLVLSDPKCGYCSTGTSYWRARQPLGPWEFKRVISRDSCSGQPAAVSEIAVAGGESQYVLQVDQWHNEYTDAPFQSISTNQTLAPYRRLPLEFTADGELMPLDCSRRFPENSALPTLQAACDIGRRYGQQARLQEFRVDRSGTLEQFGLRLFRYAQPNRPLEVSLWELDTQGVPFRNVYQTELKELPLLPQWTLLKPEVVVEAGRRYGVRLRADLNVGCYGAAHETVGSGAFRSLDFGRHWHAVSGALALQFKVRP